MTDEERIVREHDGWTHGQAVVITEENGEMEMWGIGFGDEGTLHICEVGAEEHDNLQVAMYFVPEGSDEPLCKVQSDWIEEL